MKFLSKLAVLAAIIPATLPFAAAAEEGNTLAKRAKYFLEVGGSAQLAHTDRRFFKEEISYEEHLKGLRRLARSYLAGFEKMGAETWIAHGTLLGWWWNGKVMPWDYDLDVQVSTATLRYLGENWNQTEHVYPFVDDDGVTHNRTYLLDINPHHVDITRGDGANIIDARWIDMSTGAFVDITGVGERDPENHPGIWSCKNYHKYKTTDIYPLRITEYEGVKATVPYNFERILIKEYGAKSLVTTEWQGHRWNPDVKEWIKTPEKIKQEAEEKKKKEEEKKKKEEEEKKKKEEEEKKKKEEEEAKVEETKETEEKKVE